MTERGYALKVRKSDIAKIIGILPAVAVAYLVSTWVYWILEARPGSDIHNYTAFAFRFSNRLAGEQASLIEYLTSEVHFHFWFEQLTLYFSSEHVALQVISFTSTLIVLYYTLSRSIVGSLIGTLILTHPRVLDMLASQQRQAIALAAFVLAMNANSRIIKYGFMILSMSFHTYSVVLVVSYLVFERLSQIDREKRRRALIIIFIAIVVLGSVVLQQAILNYIGDRRSGLETDSSGLAYIAMWLGTVFIIHKSKPDFLITSEGALFYMLQASQVAAALLGLFSSRYLAIALVLLAVSNFHPKGQNALLFVGVYGLNLALSFYYWV